VERDGPHSARWTDGEAGLPVPEMSGHVILEVHLAGEMVYAADTGAANATGRRVAA
jgi:hypothetical protein